METDKNEYLVDEKITINASWELNYNIANEIASIQVQIFNNSNDIIWNSSQYSEIGLFDKSWIINILDLDLNFSLSINTLYIKFYFYYFHIDTTNTISKFLETFVIIITKKNLSYEIEGGKSSIIYGESTNFTVRIYETLTNSNISEKNVDFRVISNSLVILHKQLITNINGIMSINLKSPINLSLGNNLLTFFIEGGDIYNSSNFSLKIVVRKIPTFLDILNFQNLYETNENINISFFFYYGQNTPIRNESINVSLYNKNNNTLIYQNIHDINDLGIVQFKIPVCILKNNGQNYTLSLIFEGTSILENNSYSFDINYKEIIPKERKGIAIVIIISNIVGVVGLVISNFLFLNRKKII